MRPKGTSKELERRRLRAMKLLKGGQRAKDIAHMLGLTPGAISQWKKLYQRDGPAALKAKPHPGPKPKLTAQHRQKLARLLLKGPSKHGYATELWTLKRVAQVMVPNALFREILERIRGLAMAVLPPGTG